MPARRKVSPRQIELLVEFAETHREIALGRFSGGPLSSQAARQAWASIAVQLNSVAVGSTKTPDQWRRYWIEFKAKTKTKAADSRRNASATGGGPNKLIPLNDIEQRVLALIGPVAVEGLPGVRLPIVPSTDLAPAADHASSLRPLSPQTPNADLITSEPAMLEEWLEESPSSYSAAERPQPPATLPTVQVQSEERLEVEEPRREDQSEVEVASGEDRLPQHSAHSQHSAHPQHSVHSPRRLRSQRRNRDDWVPRWAIDVETGRVDAEQRIAAALEMLTGLIREIRDDVRSYTRRNDV